MQDGQKVQLQVGEVLLELKTEERVIWGNFLI